MNLDNIIKLIENRSSVDVSILDEVEMLHKKFPYTSLFPMMLLKGLKDNKNIHFDAELRKLAIQINDREVLERYLTERLTAASIIDVEPIIEKKETKAIPIEKEIEVVVTKEEIDKIDTEAEPVNEEAPSVEKEVEDIVLKEEKDTIEIEAKAVKEELIPIEREIEEIVSKEEEDAIEAEEEAIQAKKESICANIDESIDAETLLKKLKAQVSFIEKEVQLSKKSAKKKKKKEKKEKKNLAKSLAEQQSDSPFKFKEFKGEDEKYYHLEIDFSDLEPLQKEEETDEDNTERFDFEKHPEIDKIVEENTPTHIIKEEQILKLNHDEESAFLAPVKMDINEQTEMTFLDWLKINKKKVALEKTKKIKPKNSLINTFIENSPSITQPKKEFYSPTKNAKKSLEDNLEIVTQTLAELHVFQKNYSKAKKIYKRLILKNPEKKSLFAQKLEEISKLQKKN